MQVLPLGQEGPLEESIATHSNIYLPRESHGQKSLAVMKLNTTEAT